MNKLSVVVLLCYCCSFASSSSWGDLLNTKLQDEFNKNSVDDDGSGIRKRKHKYVTQDETTVTNYPTNNENTGIHPKNENTGIHPTKNENVKNHPTKNENVFSNDLTQTNTTQTDIVQEEEEQQPVVVSTTKTTNGIDVHHHQERHERPVVSTTYSNTHSLSSSLTQTNTTQTDVVQGEEEEQQPVVVSTKNTTTTNGIDVHHHQERPVSSTTTNNTTAIQSLLSSSSSSYPWFTYLKFTKTSMIGENASYTSTFGCGGSLIHEDMVVTAAHCFDMSLIMKDTMTTTIYINATTTTTNDLDDDDNKYDENPNSSNEYVYIRHVHEIFIHPNYNAKTYDNDVAIVRLNRSVPKNEISPLVLATEEEKDLVMSTVGVNIVFDDEDNEKEELLPTKSLVLQQVNLQTVSCQQQQSQPQRRKNEQKNQVVCVTPTANNSCSSSGDAGGPLLIQSKDTNQFRLFGIVSFGIGCQSSNEEGRNVRISGYIDYIQNQICTKSIAPPSSCSTGTAPASQTTTTESMAQQKSPLVTSLFGTTNKPKPSTTKSQTSSSTITPSTLSPTIASSHTKAAMKLDNGNRRRRRSIQVSHQSGFIMATSNRNRGPLHLMMIPGKREDVSMQDITLGSLSGIKEGVDVLSIVNDNDHWNKQHHQTIVFALSTTDATLCSFRTMTNNQQDEAGIMLVPLSCISISSNLFPNNCDMSCRGGYCVIVSSSSIMTVIRYDTTTGELNRKNQKEYDNFDNNDDVELWSNVVLTTKTTSTESSATPIAALSTTLKKDTKSSTIGTIGTIVIDLTTMKEIARFHLHSSNDDHNQNYPPIMNEFYNHDNNNGGRITQYLYTTALEDGVTIQTMTNDPKRQSSTTHILPNLPHSIQVQTLAIDQIHGILVVGAIQQQQDHRRRRRSTMAIYDIAIDPMNPTLVFHPMQKQYIDGTIVAIAINDGKIYYTTAENPDIFYFDTNEAFKKVESSSMVGDDTTTQTTSTQQQSSSSSLLRRHRPHDDNSQQQQQVSKKYNDDSTTTTPPSRSQFLLTNANNNKSARIRSSNTTMSSSSSSLSYNRIVVGLLLSVIGFYV